MTFTPSERWLVIWAMGFLNWLLIFLLGLCLLPLELESHLIALVAYAAAIILATSFCAWEFLQQTYVARRREGVILGICWTLVALLLDVAAHWLVDGTNPLDYVMRFAPFLVLIFLVCSMVGLLLRFAETLRSARRVKRAPPMFRKR